MTLFQREMSEHQGQWSRVLKDAMLHNNVVVSYYIHILK